jgi:metal-sulfur cluster biosynthetic enzyme
VELQLVWEPAWNKERMSDEAKLALGYVLKNERNENISAG